MAAARDAQLCGDEGEGLGRGVVLFAVPGSSLPSLPPATSTRPSMRVVAVAPARRRWRLDESGAIVPLAELKTSADCNTTPLVSNRQQLTRSRLGVVLQRDQSWLPHHGDEAGRARRRIEQLHVGANLTAYGSARHQDSAVSEQRRCVPHSYSDQLAGRQKRIRNGS